MLLQKSRKQHRSAANAPSASAASSALSSPPPSPSPVFQEDPLSPFAEFDFVVSQSQWSSLRTKQRSTIALHPTLWNIFRSQSSAFKINLSFGFILRNKTSGELCYFHSSKINSGRFLDAPHLITNAFDFQRFLDSFVELDILSWALIHCPNSEWICDLESNVTFYVNLIEDHPLVALTSRSLTMCETIQD